MLTQAGWSGAKQQPQTQQQQELKEEMKAPDHHQAKTAQGGAKSESTCDVVDSKKKLEMTAGSSSSTITASTTTANMNTNTSANTNPTLDKPGKMAIECDSRVVQFKEMDRNFERILASVAVQEVEEEELKEEQEIEEIKEEKEPETIATTENEIVIGEASGNVEETEGSKSSGVIGEVVKKEDLPVAMEETVNEGAAADTTNTTTNPPPERMASVKTGEKEAKGNEEEEKGEKD